MNILLALGLLLLWATLIGTIYVKSDKTIKLGGKQKTSVYPLDSERIITKRRTELANYIYQRIIYDLDFRVLNFSHEEYESFNPQSGYVKSKEKICAHGCIVDVQYCVYKQDFDSEAFANKINISKAGMELFYSFDTDTTVRNIASLNEYYYLNLLLPKIKESLACNQSILYNTNLKNRIIAERVVTVFNILRTKYHKEKSA